MNEDTHHHDDAHVQRAVDRARRVLALAHRDGAPEPSVTLYGDGSACFHFPLALCEAIGAEGGPAQPILHGPRDPPADALVVVPTVAAAGGDRLGLTADDFAGGARGVRRAGRSGLTSPANRHKWWRHDAARGSSVGRGQVAGIRQRCSGAPWCDRVVVADVDRRGGHLRHRHRVAHPRLAPPWYLA